MSQYKVINRFKETQHDDHIYEVGEPYPAEGKKLVKSRAEFLTKKHSTYKKAFLEEVEEEKKPSTTAKNTAKVTKKEPESTEKSDE